MHQTNSNITPKYRQEIHYNYVENSVFGCYSGSLHSPLLHYHYVSTSLTMQIPAETLSQTRRVCFILLCYRSVTTALTAQIPAETLSQSHRLCFIGKERDSETGLSYFGARYYDSDLMTGWLSVDPLADDFSNISPYNYCNWNPVKLKDPDGEAPWLIAGAIGAVINASVNVAGAIMDNKSASEIFASGVGGAVSGFITGATSIVNPIRMVSSGIIGAGAEGLGNLVEQGINVAFGNQKEIDYSKVVVSGSIGALGNLASKGVEKGVKKVIEKPIQEKAIKKDEKLAGRPINGKAARQRINIETNLRINNIKSEKEFLKQNEKKIERATNVTTALVGNRVNNVIEK